MDELILSHLLYNDKYARLVIPHIKSEYFSQDHQKLLYSMIEEYFSEYSAVPTKEALYIELGKKQKSEALVKATKTLIKTLEPNSETDFQWLMDNTEAHCKQQSIYNALSKCVRIMKDETERGAIPDILQKAMEVTFDVHIGHDFLDDATSRFDYYHDKRRTLQFDIDFLNKVTNGGFPDKSLNLFMAPPGVGKTLHMCHYAAYHLIAGKNVLYITLEMAEERIAQRIDQNLMGITSRQLMDLTRLEFIKKVEAIKETTKGKLVVKEYAPGEINVNHINLLLRELKNKNGFFPDVIYVDYLALVGSSRVNMDKVNTYVHMKYVAEELRGLSVKLGPPVISAIQGNRDAIGNSDMDMNNVAESMGIAHTADFMLAIIANEELDEMKQVMYKQIKNRYGDVNMNKRFMVGVDRARMRLYNVAEEAQEDVVDNGPVMDAGEIMERENETKKFDNHKFRGFF